MKILFIYLIILINLAGVFAEEPVISFNIKYISAEHVYISGGRNDGLMAGDTLTIVRDNQLVASIQILFVADNSSSCAILNQKLLISTNDIAMITKILNEDEQMMAPKTTEPETTERTIRSPELPSYKSEPLGVVSGKTAFQYFYYDDKSPTDLDFSQPTLRLNLTAERLGGRKINFNLKMRSRQNFRSKSYSSNVGKNEWRNKIYEMSFEIGDKESRYSLEIGRVIPRNISGIGYLDGILLKNNISKSFTAGLFGGTQPRWQYVEFRTALQKYGAFVNINKGEHKKLRFESSMALAGEYHSSIISREFIYLRNFISVSNNAKLYQSLVIDINRDWRKAKTSRSIALSDLYISLGYQLTAWLNSNLSYDSRQNYLTYDTRNLVEDLFDNNTRQGLNGNLNVKVLANLNLSGGLGYRKRETEAEATYSYTGSLRKSNITGQMFFAAVNFTGFTGEFSDGSNLSVRLGKYFKRGDQITVYYGLYQYKYENIADNRKSSWLGFNANIKLYRNFYLYIDNQYNFGDDLDGQKMLAEFGYRF